MTSKYPCNVFPEGTRTLASRILSTHDHSFGLDHPYSWSWISNTFCSLYESNFINIKHVHINMSLKHIEIPSCLMLLCIYIIQSLKIPKLWVIHNLGYDKNIIIKYNYQKGCRLRYLVNLQLVIFYLAIWNNKLTI